MKELQKQSVWCVWSSHIQQFIGANGEPAEADNLGTFDEASDQLFLLSGDRWPVGVSLAVNLDQAALICLTLLNCFDPDREVVKEGAAAWVSEICSYTERCITNAANETAVRILCRGQLPDNARLPAPVMLQTTGFVTLTAMRIPARPPFLKDNLGRIVDATEALATLLVPRKPQYIEL